MASYYWIKLYHEILDDPKMGLLPDNVWRRAIELFLLAGQLGQGGQLPSTVELAWRLRQSPEQLAAELEKLVEVGLVVAAGEGWLVVNFARRQGAASGQERVRRYRERQRRASLSARGARVALSGKSEPGRSGVEGPVEGVGEAAGDGAGGFEAGPGRWESGSVTNRYIETEAEKETEGETERERSGGQQVVVGTGQRSERCIPLSQRVPAYKIWVENGLSREISRQQMRRLDEEVGRSPPALRLLGQICRAWDGLGWRKTNVSGVLDYYGRREIPGGTRGRRANGGGQNEIPGLRYGGSIQKQVDLASGRTYYWDWQRQQEVAGPGAAIAG